MENGLSFAGPRALRISRFNQVEQVTITQPSWVFGYGSLIWKQDFPYLESRPGKIMGWARRFWQGSHNHRGLDHDPGRVVTLVAAPGEHCYGRVFLIEPGVFEHLDQREKNGYERIAVEFTFESGGVNGIVYRASENNAAFLGSASPVEMAAQINRRVGLSKNWIKKAGYEGKQSFDQQPAKRVFDRYPFRVSLYLSLCRS
jgi:cation transport protein ChaC